MKPSEVTNKKAAAYVRVSTKVQRDEGYSFSFQLRDIHDYAKRNGFSVVAELKDAISGTKKWEERPAGRQLLALIDSKAIDAVILWVNDRTGRDEYSLEYLQLKSRLYGQGMELHYTDTGLDPDGFVGNITGYIKNQAAAEERRRILKRSMEGKQEKAQSGKWVGVSKPPYGYTKIGLKKNAYLIKNPEQLMVVRRIFEEYTGWHTGKPKTLAQVADELIAEGIPAPQGNNRISKYGNLAWYRKTLRDIIRQKLYIGIWIYNGIEVQLPHLAEIELELWRAANNHLKENQSYNKRNTRKTYLLQGMLRCQCGFKMGCRAYQKGRNYKDALYLYYRCNRRIHDHISPCGTKNVRTDLVDKVAWLWICRLLLDPVEMEKALQDMIEQKESAIIPLQERLAEIQKRIDESSRQMYGIMEDLRALGDSTGPAREILQKDLKTLDKAIAGWKDERDRLNMEIEYRQLSDEDKVTIMRMAENIRSKLSTEPTFEQKRELLRMLDFQAEYREGENGERWLDMRCGLSSDCEIFRLDCVSVTSLDIGVLDHLVIAGGRFVSLKERGLGFG